MEGLLRLRMLKMSLYSSSHSALPNLSRAIQRLDRRSLWYMPKVSKSSGNNLKDDHHSWLGFLRCRLNSTSIRFPPQSNMHTCEGLQ